MNLKEFYQSVDGDYESVLGRLGSEQMVSRFLKKCVEKEECAQLEKALSEERWQDAFVNAHNLKGYGLNLSLTALTKSSSDLSEALRGGESKGDIDALLSAVKADYEKMAGAVANLE